VLDVIDRRQPKPLNSLFKCLTSYSSEDEEEKEEEEDKEELG
jgi:hypothetical protein